MNKDKTKVQLLLETVFSNAVATLDRIDGLNPVKCLKVQLDTNNGEIQVFDDAEHLLEKNVIFEWAEKAARGNNPYPQARHFIWVTLAALKNRRLFDNDVFDRPFSVAIVDDNFNPTDVVFELKDDMQQNTAPSSVQHDGRLMKNLEHELNAFYKKIFEE
jgi:hypothetical protein